MVKDQRERERSGDYDKLSVEKRKRKTNMYYIFTENHIILMYVTISWRSTHTGKFMFSMCVYVRCFGSLQAKRFHLETSFESATGYSLTTNTGFHRKPVSLNSVFRGLHIVFSNYMDD